MSCIIQHCITSVSIIHQIFRQLRWYKYHKSLKVLFSMQLLLLLSMRFKRALSPLVLLMGRNLKGVHLPLVLLVNKRFKYYVHLNSSSRVRQTVLLKSKHMASGEPELP